HHKGPVTLPRRVGAVRPAAYRQRKTGGALPPRRAPPNRSGTGTSRTHPINPARPRGAREIKRAAPVPLGRRPPPILDRRPAAGREPPPRRRCGRCEGGVKKAPGAPSTRGRSFSANGRRPTLPKRRRPFTIQRPATSRRRAVYPAERFSQRKT